MGIDIDIGLSNNQPDENGTLLITLCYSANSGLEVVEFDPLLPSLRHSPILFTMTSSRLKCC